MESDELDRWLSGPVPRDLTPQVRRDFVENRGARLGCGVAMGLFVTAFAIVVAVLALQTPQGFVDLALDLGELARVPCQVTRVSRFSVPRGPSGFRAEYAGSGLGAPRGASYFVRAAPPEQGSTVWVEHLEGRPGLGRIVGSHYSMYGGPLPGLAVFLIMMLVALVALALPIHFRRRELRLLRLGAAAKGTLRWKGRAVAVVEHEADGRTVEATVALSRGMPGSERLREHHGPVRLVYDREQPTRIKVLEHLVASDRK